MPFSESESFLPPSPRQIICSETAIGRPASITRKTLQRASSRRFCSRSIPSGIQSFLYLSDLFAHFLTHRIELGVERAAESDPVLAPHVFERHRRAKFEQRTFYLLPSLGIALSHGAVAIEHRLDRRDIDSDYRYEDEKEGRDRLPAHMDAPVGGENEWGRRERSGCETHHGFRASPVSIRRKMRRFAPVRTFRATGNGRRLFLSSCRVLTWCKR